MCQINRQQDLAMLSAAFSFIGKLAELEHSSRQPSRSTNVLETATMAYQQGKITKQQYFAVINALDEASPVDMQANLERAWLTKY